MVARSRCFNNPVNLLIVAARSHCLLNVRKNTSVYGLKVFGFKRSSFRGASHVTTLVSKLKLERSRVGAARAEQMQRKMTRVGLLLSVAFVLPVLVVCDYPWPDKATQHKGYIEVNCLT